MAKTDAPQTSSGGSNWLAVVVAILAIGLFMGWLMMQRPDESVAIEEPSAVDAPDAADGAFTVVTADELATTARVRELRGQDIRVNDIEVVSVMGDQLFWLQLPNGNPFLAKLDSASVAAGTTAPQPGRYTIVGRVLEKNETTLADWQQAGVLRSDGDRMQAEFGTSYIEARRVRPAGS
jgi:hypothetical protein